MYIEYKIEKKVRSIIRRCCCRGYSSRNISYNEMLELMKNNPVVIIDVRSKQEFAEGHFDGAINIPLCDIKKSIGSIVPNKNQIIILYCSEGIRSMKAKKILDSNITFAIPSFLNLIAKYTKTIIVAIIV